MEPLPPRRDEAARAPPPSQVAQGGAPQANDSQGFCLFHRGFGYQGTRGSQGPLLANSRRGPPYGFAVLGLAGVRVWDPLGPPTAAGRP